MSVGQPDPDNRKMLKRREKRVAEAHAAGGYVRFGKSSVLLVDVDSREQLAVARDLLRRFDVYIGVDHVSYTRSKSRNWHLYVYLLEDMPRGERLLMQGILGGDRARAILDWEWAIGRGQLDECFLIEVEGAVEKEFDYQRNDAGLDEIEMVPYDPLTFLKD